MLEIAGGINLAFFPYLLVFALYLIPPALGVVIGGFIGAMVAEGDGMLAGALFGLIGGIWVDLALTRECGCPWPAVKVSIFPQLQHPIACTTHIWRAEWEGEDWSGQADSQGERISLFASIPARSK